MSFLFLCLQNKIRKIEEKKLFQNSQKKMAEYEGKVETSSQIHTK